jgi:hypothetical protein
MTIKEIDDAIKEVFDKVEALDISTVYEKEGDNYKLVIFLNKIYIDEIQVLYTKFIFPVDSDKKDLLKQSFLYLYDINCLYRNVDFNDIDDFKNKIQSIIEEEKFGGSIKILSKFMDYPATLVNNWFSDNKISDINIISITYSPKVSIIPCKFISFDFTIKVNNVDIDLILTKENKDDFRYEFIYPDGVDKIDKVDLTDMVQTIGTSIKNNIS